MPALNDANDTTDDAMADRNATTQCWVTRMGARFSVPGYRNPDTVYQQVPQTSQERRDASLTAASLDQTVLSPSDIEAGREKGKTVLYLAYGSNLCKETFRGKRGIKPLSQVNVLVPSLRLTFDLPGLPYIEPCFANSAMRNFGTIPNTDYHKDRWKKGLVDCVYEVTLSDYAHIIATEGGGAGYQDILVDCYPLADGDAVPENPTTKKFVAHTLFAPSAKSKARPDPSYAQPSARYLNLITTGAAELSLPQEYQLYLKDIRPYTITTKRQQMGKVLFLTTWFPFLQLLFALNAQFQDDKGRSPPWLAQLSNLLFLAIWRSYDAAYKRVFGDGERTDGDEASSKQGYHFTEEEWRKIGEDNGWFRDYKNIEDMA